jgi:hypothetical protein
VVGLRRALWTPAVGAAWFRAYVRWMASTSWPIVVGPFRSELGFEVLYWMPMVRWALQQHGIDPGRVVVLSRGGMGGLYSVGQAVDLYSLRTVDQVRLENVVDAEARGLQKQLTVTEWDRQVSAEALTAAGLSTRRYHLFHPAWMYRTFAPWWDDQSTHHLIARHTDYAPLPLVPLPQGLTLPPKFCAVRFYERHTLPMNTETQQIVTDMVRGVAKQMPVVLLNQPDVCADDHVDFPVGGDNIFSLPRVTPETNFLIQAAVLARAQAFVGTYGGMSQFALRYGRGSLSFYTQFSGTALAHRELSTRLALGMRVPFETCDLRATALYKSTIGNIMLVPPRASSVVAAVTVTPPVPEVVDAGATA